MPVMCIIRASKVTPEKYEEVRRRVDWDRDRAVGAITYAIAFPDDGAVEVTVWESKSHFDTYAGTRLKPVLDAMGIELDQIEILETYAVAISDLALPHMVPDPALTPA